MAQPPGWEYKEEWFYVMNKRQTGPATLSELASLFSRGKSAGGIGPDTHVWCGAMVEWKRLKDLPLLQLLRGAAAPEPAVSEVAATSSIAGTEDPRKGRIPPFGGSQMGTDMGTMPNSAPAARSLGTANPAAVAPAASVSPFAGSSPPVSGGPARSGGAGKGGADSVKGKHGKVKNFLLGWLPQRTPPRDLVERGILPDEPLRTRGSPTTGAQGNAPNAIFGNDLAAILRRADTVDGVPRAVEILMSRLRADGCAGLRNEGIFRVPGDATEMRELRDAMNQGRDPLVVLSQCQNVHSVAGMLKMFYRELSPPLLSFALYDDLISASSRIGAPDEDADLSELMGLLRRLPQGNQDSLCHLFGFLVEVTQNASESKMTVGNTAAVFAPNLLRPERETLQHLADTGHVVNLIATMIAKYEQIFLCRSPTTTTPDDSMASLRLSRDSSSSLALSRSPQHSFVSMNSTSHGSLQHASSTLFPGAGEVEPVEESAGGDSDEDEDETNALKWYWLTPDSQQQGPVSWADLHAMSQAMEIDGSTYLFCDGLGDWKTAADLGLC